MDASKRIKSALISVYDKTGLEPILHLLQKHNVNLFSTGGTELFIRELGIPVNQVEELTSFPEILGGRVKTLHPKIFGGILSRRSLVEDQQQLIDHDIPEIDLVIVDLYPFEETVNSSQSHEEIIEKIDIGGISLIRAAAKNYQDVLVVSSKKQYEKLAFILNNQSCETTISQRKIFASDAFNLSSHYDYLIFSYLNEVPNGVFKQSIQSANALRYGENPHQKGFYYGNLEEVFSKINGKELSYNNLLDVDAAVNLMAEFNDEKPTFAILKHTNPCGLASRSTIFEAFCDALAGDPISAFGGILIANQSIDVKTASEIDALFFEILIAPGYSDEAIQVLKNKTNRIILIQRPKQLPSQQFRSTLNGVICQDRDIITETIEDLNFVTEKKPNPSELEDLLFANKIIKHVKSNAIVLVKQKQLIACGTGQTSRVDALSQAIHKARSFGVDLNGAVMSSDAFFPFPDCVEIANQAGISSIIQPGGSVKDQLSIEFCDKHQMAMVFTGIRHFKH